MDICVTVPKNFAYNGKRGLAAWVDEKDLPGEPWSGHESFFTTGGPVPSIRPGERVYIVCEGRLRGYAPLVRLSRHRYGYGLIRHGDAVAVTIPESIRGFRGFRYRWWQYGEERPFPDWAVQHGGTSLCPVE